MGRPSPPDELTQLNLPGMVGQPGLFILHVIWVSRWISPSWARPHVLPGLNMTPGIMSTGPGLILVPPPPLFTNSRSLLSSMSSCGFHRIPNGKSEFHGIPWNFYGKHLAGSSAIWVSISMEIPTFFQGIPMEMVGIWEPPGMIPNGIHGIPLEFH